MGTLITVILVLGLIVLMPMALDAIDKYRYNRRKNRVRSD